jgi:hypothetical protein
LVKGCAIIEKNKPGRLSGNVNFATSGTIFIY